MYQALFFCVSLSLFFIYLICKAYTESKNIQTVDQFLFVKDFNSLPKSEDYIENKQHSGLSRTGSWITNVASNFQTASVLYVGMYFGYSFGLAMLVTAISFAGGMILLRFYLIKTPAHKRQFLLDNNSRPFANLLHKMNDSKYSTKIVMIIYLAVLFSAVLETWFGTQVTDQFLVHIIENNNAEGSLIKYIDYFGLMLVLITLFIYVYVGGYKSVEVTDEIQLRLIAAMLVLLMTGVLAYVFHNWNQFDWLKIIVGREEFSGKFTYLGVLMTGAFVLNVFWQFVDPQQWQRARATSTAEEYISGLKTSSFGVFATWSVPIFCGAAMASVCDIPKGEVLTYPFFFLSESLNSIWGPFGKLLSVILLTVAAAGIIAAAISSADTAIMAYVSQVCPTEKKLSVLRNKAFAATLVMWTLAFVLYLYHPNIENVIFSAYSAQLVFAPLFILQFLSGSLNPLSLFTQRAACAAYIIFLTLSIAANFFNFFGIPYFSFIIPILCLLLGVILTLSNRGEA